MMDPPHARKCARSPLYALLEAPDKLARMKSRAAPETVISDRAVICNLSGGTGVLEGIDNSLLSIAKPQLLLPPNFTISYSILQAGNRLVLPLKWPGIDAISCRCRPRITVLSDTADPPDRKTLCPCTARSMCTRA